MVPVNPREKEILGETSYPSLKEIPFGVDGDPDAKRAEIEAMLQSISSPFRNAHAFGIEELIDPRDTRPLLIDFIEDAWKVIQTQLGPGRGPAYTP